MKQESHGFNRVECQEINEITPIGEGTPYPQDGGEERNVENYGNEEADRILAGFAAAEAMQNSRHLSSKELDGLKKASDIAISMVKQENPVIKALNQSYTDKEPNKNEYEK